MPVVLAGLALVGLDVAPAAAQRLAGDPRAAAPPRPATLQEVVDGFVPTFIPVGAVEHQTVPDEGELRIVRPLVAGACYAAIGLSTAIADLDAWVRIDGVLVAQDVQFDAWPVSRFCALRDGEVELAFSAYASGGPAEFGLFVDPSTLEEVAGDAGELENRLRSAVSRTAPGWVWSDAPWLRGFAGPETAEFSVDIVQGSCAAVVAVATAGIEDLDLVARDPDGLVVASDLALDARPAIVHCSAQPTTLVVEVAVSRGRGVAMAQILYAPL